MAHELLITFPDEKTRIEFLSKLDNDLWSDTYGEDWQHLLKNVDRIFYELPDQEDTLKDRGYKTVMNTSEAGHWLERGLPPGKTFEEHFWGWKDGKPPVKAKGGLN